ncbi:hypothetical protein BSPWISOXPB_5231 [uncultured Gammaproteobacteria bacterium]|nr:hypothetical protein BSPWISOXPB_5231 [uncultured Gammaproteobacteria bacterium]
MAYTAFGERRKGDWRVSDPLLPIIPALTNRGFTGHEHIDEMGLIHMNGRVYDPQIGRFLSADPYIQSPYNTQSYNRYSYTINNPLKYTDPTGNFFGVILGFISAMTTKAVIAAIGTKLFLAKIIIAYAVTYSVTYIATGSAKAAQSAGLSAALFTGIGGLRGGKMGANGKMQYNPGWESGSMKTLAAHGLAGGIVQDRIGGSFGAGFLSGSLGSYLGSSGHSKNMSEMIGNTARDAVVGGTISVIGGGKFANGAQTGAFRYLFNEWTHDAQKPSIPISAYERRLAKRGAPLSRVLFWHMRNSEGDPFALTALDVVANRGLRGISANMLAPINNEQLGINLMVDYVDWVDRDYADTSQSNWRGVLSNDQINSWHNNTFDRTPWSGTYGGNIPFTDSMICSTCDSYNP